MKARELLQQDLDKVLRRGAALWRPDTSLVRAVLRDTYKVRIVFDRMCGFPDLWFYGGDFDDFE